MLIYTVKRGDTLSQISRNHGIPVNRITCDNQLSSDSLTIGQTLVLNVKPAYTVKQGDTLYSIASAYGTNVNMLQKLNPAIADAGLIYPGQELHVPAKKKFGSLAVNGYSYTNVNCNDFKTALPSLSYLSIFSYEVLPDGSLRPIADDWLIQSAELAKTDPRMVITNISPDTGRFNSDLASAILNDPSVQDIVLQNSVSVMQMKGYTGLDIDFEYVYPQDRERYNEFLIKARDLMHANGYSLTSAVAPKTSANQIGTLYEAHDYNAHGQYSDEVIIMTYEWGYAGGPPMAVAPLNRVRSVLDYAVTAIPREKILMGIPNYGYDWTLPYTQGTTARSIGNLEAVELALRQNAQIHHDPVAQSPYFNYRSADGKQHVVWFEDAASIEAKLNLVHEYGLGGISYWTINRPFPQNWLVLGSLFDIKKEL